MKPSTDALTTGLFFFFGEVYHNPHTMAAASRRKKNTVPLLNGSPRVFTKNT